MKPRVMLAGLLLVGVAACADQAPLSTEPDLPVQSRAGRPDQAIVGVNVLLTTSPTKDMLDQLADLGRVRGQIPEIDAVLMVARQADIPAIQALPFVAAANTDAERTGQPVDAVPVPDFADGMSTWNLDAVNVTEIGIGTRTVAYDGEGAYIGIIDTGLLDTWRQYFPEERIASEYAKSFSGGGRAGIHVSEQPYKWEHDTRSHGTHVASTILGYSFWGFPMNGVAPRATVIPIKIQQGAGWSSVIAASVLYLAELKRGPLHDHPVVVNMSLSGFGYDALERAAIDYAIDQGVIIVASAGNSGMLGMVYPAAYEPVISVAATGWDYAWSDCGLGPENWWWTCNVTDPTDPDEHYIAPFSSRAKPGQDLDLAAPGSLVVGPWQFQMGKISYYFLDGTSMSSPHVAGVVALMAQKKGDLTASEAEAILESTATPLPFWGPVAAGSGLLNAEAALVATPVPS
jgi:subtilisin family serine protease